jgi:phosphoribosyl-ATP pyrophosphohydrolase
MIVPSIDIRGGRAVQLRRGRELILDGGSPLERLEEFSVAGEVAVVDLDAAVGTGSNTALVREMVRLAPCRVGGGIRSLEAARRWLDDGAAHIVIGTAATVELCSALSRDRVIVAADAIRGRVVVDGWRQSTDETVFDRIRTFAPVVGGFLITQVEHEGGLAGFDRDLVREVVAAAGAARVTAAGGITSPADVSFLDAIGADAQVGMALYSGAMSLGAALAAPLRKPVNGHTWPTVVCDESGRALGLVWSTRESLERAVRERRGVYWSRSREELWTKGESSGAMQTLLRVDLDCDRDAIRFVVRQHGTGFCHTGSWSCWPESFSLATLERIIADRGVRRPEASGTRRLLDDPALLRSKLLEEAGELADASNRSEVAHEMADLVYFALVVAARGEVTLPAMLRELELRHGRITPRPMVGKSHPVDHEAPA